MRYYWVPLFLVVAQFLYSQQRQIDSIQLELAKHTGQDTLRLNLLTELTYLYYSIDPLKGIASSEEALSLAQQLSDSNKIATAYAYKGHNYSALGKDSLALNMYEQASEIRKKNKDESGMARLIYNKGLVYFNRADYLRANDCNRQAYEVFKKEKDSFLMAKMLNSIGINYMYLSQLPQSLDAYLEAKMIYEDLKLQDNLEYANINSNIGLLYARLEKLELAEEFQKIALEQYKKIGFEEGEANSLTNLGRLSTENGNTKKAVVLYQEAFSIMEKNQNQRGMASALTNIGIAYVEDKAYEKAIPYFIKTQKIYQDLDNENNLSIVQKNLGDCYYRLFKAKGNARDLQTAENYYQKSMNNAEEAKAINLQFESNNALSKVYKEQGKFRKALASKENAAVLRDSFMSTDKTEEIARLEAKYEYEKDKAQLTANFEKEQAVAKAELKKQHTINRILLVSGVLLCLMAAVGFVLYKKRRDALTQKKNAEFNAQVSETELKALRSQMNPHFIFNSFNSIRDYMSKNDFAKAELYLMKFAKLTRAILENSNKKWISLEEDLDLMRMYIEIESLRLKYPVEYVLKVEEDIDLENTLVPPMILQPFIENSIWHGLSTKNQGGKLKIHIHSDGEFLICVVDDNGVGRKKSIGMITSEKSMGLKITKSRIEIMNQLKNKNGSFTMKDKEEGVSVEVKLPLELQF
ncbi:tetratricopeptide repeat-containing sensor histidine kinase [Euzebyella saccharophila]|uniref:Tetratricopeptide repeat protein n=1 Tax=Euzebyella saccharophila TaxID=679664 RepID=A0ABV8JIM4_9FLAO|nr:tetratricopeptide repeat protein [Euzebyella saccharophila]